MKSHGAAILFIFIALPAWANDTQANCAWQQRCSSQWAITQAFRVAYVSWVVDNFSYSSKQRQQELERSFSDDYSFYALDVLQMEVSDRFSSRELQHQVSFSIELSKNPFGLSSAVPDEQIANNFHPVPIQSSFAVADFWSKKNALDLYFEYEVTQKNRLAISLGGEINIAVPDNTDILNAPIINQRDYTTFSPEIEIAYQLTNATSLYASFNRALQPVLGSNFNGESLKSKIDTELELGIETEFFAGFSVNLYYNNSIYKNVTTTDPAYPDFEIQIDEQQHQSLGLYVIGEITPGWDIVAYYAYTDARITKDQRFLVDNQINDVPQYSGGVWTTYEISAGALQGLGFGGGLWFVGKRVGDLDNVLTLPSYLQTDVAIFYRGEHWKAAINVENLFDVEYLDGTPLTVIGTVWVEF